MQAGNNFWVRFFFGSLPIVPRVELPNHAEGTLPAPSRVNSWPSQHVNNMPISLELDAQRHSSQDDYSRFTVFIRCPFPRGDFVDPPPVSTLVNYSINDIYNIEFL